MQFNKANMSSFASRVRLGVRTRENNAELRRRSSEGVNSRRTTRREKRQTHYVHFRGGIPPLSPHNPTMQMLLESSFPFCTQQVTTRLHSGEAATAGEDGVTRTVIGSACSRRHRSAVRRGSSTPRWRPVASRWKRPQQRGSSKTGQPQAAAAENRSKDQ